MDLSRSFQSLIKVKLQDLTCSSQTAQQRGTEIQILTIRFSYNGQKLICGAAGKTGGMLYARALSEIGETIIASEQGLENRCGLAGGFFSSGIIERAKNELLERDAFFFHYRRNIPFLALIQKAQNFYVSQMNLLDTSRKGVLVYSPFETILGPSFAFGTAVGFEKENLEEKALQEFAVMSHNTQLYAKMPADKELGPYHMHKRACFDPINIERFSALIERSPANESREDFAYKDWVIKEQKSPIRFFSYFKLSHPQLMPMSHGQAETWYPDRKIYHPFY